MPLPTLAAFATSSGIDRYSRFTNLLDTLHRAAHGDRGVVLVGDEDVEERRSYAALYRAARRRAAALRATGIEPGDRVVIVLNTSFAFIESFFGVILAGAVPVPAYPPVAMSRIGSYQQLLAHIISVTGARLLITDRTIGALLGTLYGECPALEAIVNVERLDRTPPEVGAPDPAPGPEATCFIQCTSGSTSAPRPVVLSHRALLANLEGMARAYELRDDDVYVSWLPLYHDLGLIGALLGAIARGIELVLLPPDVFIMEPAAWWRAISRHRGTVTAAPNFAYGLSVKRMDADDVAALELSSLRIAASGAEPILPRTVQAFNDKLAPAGLHPGAFSPAYGLAESCVAVTLTPLLRPLRVDRINRQALAASARPRALPEPDAAATQECVSVGRPLHGTRVTIVDERGRALPERHVGEVVVSGPSLMSGYLDDPDATRQVMRGDTLHTGDLGYMADGELFVVGRLKNMLIVRGRNYHAEDIELAADELPGVRRGNVVAFGVYDERRGEDRLHIVAETRTRTPAERERLEERVRGAVAGAIGLRPHRVLLVPPGTIPKTSSGKKRRAACREALTSGTLLRPPARARRLAIAWVLIASQLARVWHAVRVLCSRRHGDGLARLERRTIDLRSSKPTAARAFSE